MANLKKYKLFHWVYNLLHYRSLSHNRAAYKRYQIHKPVVASISSRNFPDKQSRAWLDAGSSRELAPTRPDFAVFPADVQQSLLSWSDKGYLIMKDCFSPAEADAIQQETERLVARGKLSPTHDKRLVSVLSFILDKTVLPFQTINFIRGSSQRAHSDSIHMTTYPLGYLIAVWIALEDTNSDNGPLFYYPGSHRLPYLLNEDFNEGSNSLRLGRKDYGDYEDRIEATIREKQLEKEIFIAHKGDVLIWHANLIHGGMPILNPGMTRKSMVIHYYAADVIKYHEITERPSLLK